MAFLTLVSQFEGGWTENNPDYPIQVAESQGGLIGKDLLIVSGFANDRSEVTKEVWKLVSETV